MNSLYNLLNTNNNPIGSLQNALLQIKQNPVAVLRQAGLNIPEGINNPQQIINHLMQSGQIDQQRLMQAQQMANRYRY